MAFQQQCVPALRISCQEKKMEFIPPEHAGKRIFYVVFQKKDYYETSVCLLLPFIAVDFKFTV